MLRISSGTAVVLGVGKSRLDALPTTAYMMLGGRCQFDCSFCAQARNADSRQDALSRVTWPECSESLAVESLKEAFEAGSIERCCLQVTSGGSFLKETEEVVARIREQTAVPICTSVSPLSLAQVDRLVQVGVDRIGLSLDAACERVFEKVKGVAYQVEGAIASGDRFGDSRWNRTLSLVEESARRYPGKISTHLIVGLGETELEMTQMIQRLVDLEVTVGLFAFTPVKGTPMEKMSPPRIGNYRRIQVAHSLILSRKASIAGFKFENDKLMDFGLSREELDDFLKDGKPFQTSGCPGCNRPYYNEKPGGVMFNYPRPLTPEEIVQAKSEVWCD